MADDGSAATLARLVGCYGLPPPEAQAVLARAARVAAAPSGALFSTPTTLLSRVLRVLKNAAPAAHRAVVEDCFMSLVTKDNGSLPDVLALVGDALGEPTVGAILRGGAADGLNVSGAAAAPAATDGPTAGSSSSGSGRTTPAGAGAAFDASAPAPRGGAPPRAADAYLQFRAAAAAANPAPSIASLSVAGTGLVGASLRQPLAAAAAPSPSTPVRSTPSPAVDGPNAAPRASPPKPQVQPAQPPAPAVPSTTSATSEPVPLARAARPVSAATVASVAAVAVVPYTTRPPPEPLDSPLSVLLAYADAADAAAAAASAMRGRGGPTTSSPDASGAAAASAVSDPSILRYGAHVMLRSCAPQAASAVGSGRGVVAVTARRRGAPSAPAAVALDGLGLGAAREVWRVLLPAPGGGSSAAAGTPVRSGDVIVLQSALTGQSLGVSGGAGGGALLPDGASPDARSVDVSGSPASPQRWLLVAPDALAAAMSSTPHSKLPAPTAAPLLLRPLVTAHQRLVLLPVDATAGRSGVGDARASVTRLRALLAGEAVVQRPYTQYDGSTAPAVTRPVALVDSLPPAAAAKRGSTGAAASAPLDEAATSAAWLLASAPPAAALWAVAPVSARASTAAGLGGGSADFVPAPWLPAWSLSRPFLTGSHALLLAQATATAGTPGGGGGKLPLASALGALPPHLQEGVLVRHLLDALAGSPGDVVVVVAPASSPALVGTPLEHVLAIEGGGSDAASGFDLALAPALTQPGPASPAVDASLAHLSARMLPLGRHHARCAAWVERRSRPDAGPTAQALAAAARLVLREYAQLLVRLDALARRAPLFPPAPGAAGGVSPAARLFGGSGGAPTAASSPAAAAPSLSLQQLWFYLQPSLRTLAALDAALHCAPPGAGGGALQTALASFVVHSGDDAGRALGGFLLERASQPYLRALQRWLYAGQLSPAAAADAAGSEFMVVDTAAVTNAAADVPWERRFRLTHRDAIPSFLAPHAGAILTAGRYVHALRECTGPSPLRGSGGGGGGLDLASTSSSSAAVTELRATASVCPPGAGRIAFSPSPAAYGPPVAAALGWASHALLRLFTAPPAPPPSTVALAEAPVGGFGLRRVLASLKALLLTSSGDYLALFLEAAEDELARPVAASSSSGGSDVRPVSLQRLRSALDHAIRTASTSSAASSDGGSGDADPLRGCVTASLAPHSLLTALDVMAADEEADAAAAAAAAAAVSGDAAAVAAADVAAAAAARKRAALPSTSSSSGLKGYNTFVLDVAPPWPLGRVLLPPRVLAKYGALFRHLFHVAYVERAVGGAWAAQQACKELDLRATLAGSFGLRHRMMHLLGNLRLYCTAEVVEPRWHRLVEGDLPGCATLDDVLAAHGAFLDGCMADCLLRGAPRGLLKTLTKLTTLCLLFAQQIRAAIEAHLRGDGDGAAAATAAGSADGGVGRLGASPAGKAAAGGGGAAAERVRRAGRLRAQADAMRHTMAQRGWQAMIAKSGALFDGLLAEFLGGLAAHAAAGGHFGSSVHHLIARLDFNGFYSGRGVVAPPPAAVE